MPLRLLLQHAKLFPICRQRVAASSGVNVACALVHTAHYAAVLANGDLITAKTSSPSIVQLLLTLKPVTTAKPTLLVFGTKVRWSLARSDDVDHTAQQRQAGEYLPRTQHCYAL